jgi:hypothetical protein
MAGGGRPSSKRTKRAIGASRGSFEKEASGYYASGNTTSKGYTKTVWRDEFRTPWENL